MRDALPCCAPDPEPYIAGRCKSRAENGNCAKQEVRSVCKVACGSCQLCAGHPQISSYNKLYACSSPRQTGLLCDRISRVDSPRAAAFAYLSSHSCSVYLYDAHSELRFGPLPRSKVHRKFNRFHRYNVEHWLRQSLLQHPWRAPTIASADMVFIAATFAEACFADKKFYGRRLWQNILRDARLWPMADGRGIGPMSRERADELRKDTTSDWGPPKVFSLQYPACPPWMDNNHTSYVPRDAVFMTEHVPEKKNGRGTAAGRGVVTPFVVANPPWLAGAPGADPPPFGSHAWVTMARRRNNKLVFFVGHLPKVHIAGARFDVWRQVRNDPRVTTKSHDGYCLIGSYENCRLHSDEHLKAQTAAGNNSFFVKRCWSYCGGAALNIQRGMSCGASTLNKPKINERIMRSECKVYENVDLSPGVISDLKRDSELRWSEEEYHAKAFAHRFCLVIQGDFAGTPKIGEMLAMGGAGGCIPVFVLKLPIPRREHEKGLAAAVRASLPYSRWLDYCKVSYLVSEHSIRTNATRILNALQAISANEIRARRQALRGVRMAFGMWYNSTPDAPSALDFVWADLCALSKELKQKQDMSNRDHSGPLVAGSLHPGGLRRCLLA